MSKQNRAFPVAQLWTAVALLCVSSWGCEEPLRGIAAVVNYKVTLPVLGGGLRPIDIPILDGGLPLPLDGGLPLPVDGGGLPLPLDGGDLPLPLDGGLPLPPLDGGLPNIPEVRVVELKTDPVCVLPERAREDAIKAAKLLALKQYVNLPLSAIEIGNDENAVRIFPGMRCDDPIDLSDVDLPILRVPGISGADALHALSPYSNLGLADTRLDESRSSAVLKYGDEEATPTVTGNIVFQMPRADSVTLSHVVMQSSNFVLGGREFKDVAMIMEGSISSSISPTGSFIMYGSNISFHMTAVVNSKLTGQVRRLAAPIRGQLDRANRTVTLKIDLSGVEDEEELLLNATLVASVLNFPPMASVEPSIVAECSSPAGADVRLDASGTVDFDGRSDIASYRWFKVLDGAFSYIGSGERLDTTLPLGSHRIMLEVLDTKGSASRSFVQVEARDTLPPQLVWTGPTCLWPPRHDYVVLRLGGELQGLVTDACDPNPAVTITHATSNQPDNGTGDGNTVNDAMAFADRVCLRSERQGTALLGRMYQVGLEARDGAGNTSTLSAAVSVDHDQRNHACAPLNAQEFVAEGDPLCVPASPEGGAPAISKDAPPGAAGCGAAPGAGPGSSMWGLSLGAGMFWLTRSVRRRRTGAEQAAGATHGPGSSFMMLPLMLLLVLVSACDGMNGGADSCFVGTWDGTASACDETVCQGANPPQACQSTDCKIVPFLAFQEQGTHWGGFYIHSQSLRKLSFLSAPSRTDWRGSVASGVEVTDQEGKSSTLELACRQDSITISDVLYKRTSSEVTQVIESAVASGTWSEVSY